jgi:hypothetical protein
MCLFPMTLRASCCERGAARAPGGAGRGDRRSLEHLDELTALQAEAGELRERAAGLEARAEGLDAISAQTQEGHAGWYRQAAAPGDRGARQRRPRHSLAAIYRQCLGLQPVPVQLLDPPEGTQPSAWHTELASRINPAAASWTSLAESTAAVAPSAPPAGRDRRPAPRQAIITDSGDEIAEQ